MTFAFLQYNRNRKFFDKQFTLGIFDLIKEDYKSVKERFKELFEGLSTIEELEIQGKSFKVEFFFYC